MYASSQLYKLNIDDIASQKALTREIEHSIEMLKLKIFENLDIVKHITVEQVIESAKTKKKKGETHSFNMEALHNFEKALSKGLETLRFEIINGNKPFSPAIVNTLEIPANIGFNYGANVYNQKHNMIIACPSNSNIHFYSGLDFKPIKNRKSKQINSSVVQMSYNPDTDTHLMGCAFGDIYSYNATTNNLNKIMKEGDSFILAIAHLSNNTFAFSSAKSGKIYFADLNSEKAVPQYSKDSDAWYLHHYAEKSLLFSGLASGKVAIYNTKKGSNKMIDSIQAHRFGKYVTTIMTVKINGRDYVVTGGNDHTIKIWNIIRGKLRLIKVIQTTDDVSTIVYLENYKMIASTHHRDYIKFFKLPFGKVEATVQLGLSKARNIFLMKDKNLLGVGDLTRNYIKVVQLHSFESLDQYR